MEAFGSFPRVIDASPEQLTALLGGRPDIANHLAATRRAIGYCLRDRMVARPVLSGTTAVADYLQFAMAREMVEHVRALYLDSRHRLVADEVAAFGGIDSTELPVRSIIRRALELEASGVIIAHNHPSGDSSPSRADIEATRLLQEAAHGLNIHVLDHFVVAGSEIASMRALGLLSEGAGAATPIRR